MRFKYSSEQLAFLRDGYKSMKIKDLTRSFNKKFGMEKSESAIKGALGKNKITCGRKGKDRLIDQVKLLTSEQDAFVRREYKNYSLAELADQLNACFGTSFTEGQMKSYVKNHSIKSGRSGLFAKGHKPWNDGTKGQGLTGPNSGSFKKGAAPSNRKPIGSERICKKDGFLLVKVAETDPHTGFPTRYKHNHRHVWEQNFGPVPEGMVVAFKDSDKMNCDVDNLMLISRAELLRLNQNQYRETPGQLKPSVLVLSKLQVKIQEKVKEA